MLSTLSASAVRTNPSTLTAGGNNNGNGDYFAHDPHPPPSPRFYSPIPRRLTNDSPFHASPRSSPSPGPYLHSPLLSISTAFPPNSLPSPGPSPRSALPRSPYLSSRELSSSHAYSNASPIPRRQSVSAYSPGARDSWSSSPSMLEDILEPGEIVGEGLDLLGEPLRHLPITLRGDEEVAREFEVVRKLGSGSYAVVYLVREVLSRGGSYSDDGCAGRLELDDAASRKSTEYGREYAIKCLSKANLDEEALEAQMTEVTIHQSLPTHNNIVTLHRTFETSAFLLLLLEFVPGEDLFYFLEQARDHYESDPAPNAFEDALQLQRTPPTPSLLSSLNPGQLLSRTRLKLIASMFHQMCEAVATCHDVQVFHRDIKPENFIVTDGYRFLPDGTRERKVIAKLSDFGLSTTDLESSDMDCGSAPYMSYECRNNIAPTYSPRAADVWSLGVVLINMLYHFNPWTDTADGACSSFTLYRQQPVNFFLQRFTGMTPAVADFLANRVFCIIGDSADDSQRISAREFGNWVKDLPTLMCPPPGSHKRVMSTSSTQGHPLSSSLPGSRPASRQASSASAARTPAMHARSISRGATIGTAFEMDGPELSTILDQEPEMEEEEEQPEHDQDVHDREEEHECAAETESRCQSTAGKRRKRGARKGKGVQQLQSPPVPVVALPALPTKPIDVSATLAMASESLARQLSKQSKIPMPASPATTFTSIPASMPMSPIVPPEPIAVSVATATENRPSPVTKKSSSIWKQLSFSKSTAERPIITAVPTPEGPLSASVRSESRSSVGSKSMSAQASNVSSLLMGLNAAPAPAPTGELSARKPPSPVSMFAVDDGYGRGRGPATKTAVAAPQHSTIAPRPNPPPAFQPKAKAPRNTSPTSVRSGVGSGWQAQVASSASSTYSANSANSANWRSSMSSAATSTSAFTRYSNGSKQSVSTVATSVSSSSWRNTNASKPSIASQSARSPLGREESNVPPRNVKVMHGIPGELVLLPRGPENPNPYGQQASPRKQRTRKAGSELGTIPETGKAAAAVAIRTDAATSTTDLASSPTEADASADKKSLKGNKSTRWLFSALRR